jgi:hypothetical protein
LRQYFHRHPINHSFNLIESTLPLLKSSAHIPEATTIRIEFPSSWRGISNTHRAGPCQSRTSHLWYNSRVTGSTDAASPRATLCQVIGTLTPLGLTPMSPSTSLLSPRCNLPFDSWPELYYSASRSERLIRRTKC